MNITLAALASLAVSCDEDYIDDDENEPKNKNVNKNENENENKNKNKNENENENKNEPMDYGVDGPPTIAE
jgi:hypothetical protein